MTDNEHSGERVLLYVLVGIGLFAFAYLFFKDQFKRQDSIQTQPLGLGGIERTTDQLIYNNPRIDQLERQTIELGMQTNVLSEKLKSYDYQINQLSNSQNTGIPRAYHLNNLSKAGSITTIRTTGEDKVRQKDFGMN